jgi:hypothetical protein
LLVVNANTKKYLVAIYQVISLCFGSTITREVVQVPILIVREIIKREVEVPGLGQQIKQTQADSGLSIEKVIRALDISRTYWNKMVSDKDMSISVDLLRKIECFFGVDYGVSFHD